LTSNWTPTTWPSLTPLIQPQNANNLSPCFD
jgi:hypothetical protein